VKENVQGIITPDHIFGLFGLFILKPALSEFVLCVAKYY
jgi:ABC-type phosphate transport system permease subunit